MKEVEGRLFIISVLNKISRETDCNENYIDS